jgi:hypothetical protein
MKYNLYYKYYKLLIAENEYIISLGIDNTLTGEKATPSARSNVLFYEKNEGSFGHAAGIGETEEDALKMCVWEIKQYLSGKSGVEYTPKPDFKNTDISALNEVVLPYKFVGIIDKDNTATVLFKRESNGLIILTDKGALTLRMEKDILTTLCNNIDKFKESDIDKATEKYLKSHSFFPTFEATFKKHK